MASGPTTALVITTNAPAAALHDWLSYHFAFGVDHVFAFLDDPTRPPPAAFAHDDRITWTHCDAEYWRKAGAGALPAMARQRWNATAALGAARERGYDWLAHVDSDELLYTEALRVQDILAAATPDVVCLRLPVWEGVAETPDVRRPFDEVTLFRRGWKPLDVDVPNTLGLRGWQRLGTRVQAVALQLLGLGRVVFAGQYLRGHTIGKSFVRVSAPFARLLCHLPEPLPRVHTARHACVLHFSTCNYDDWNARWRAGPQGPELGTSRLRQEAAFRTATFTGGEAQARALYRRLFFLSEADVRKLTRYRALERVRIPREWLSGSRSAGAADRSSE